MNQNTLIVPDSSMKSKSYTAHRRSDAEYIREHPLKLLAIGALFGGLIILSSLGAATFLGILGVVLWG